MGTPWLNFRRPSFPFEPMLMSCLSTKSESDTVCGRFSSNFVSELVFSLSPSHAHPAGSPDLVMNRDGEVSGDFSCADLLTRPEGQG